MFELHYSVDLNKLNDDDDDDDDKTSNANFDFQNSSNANANSGNYFISGSRNVVHWFRSVE